MNFHGFCGLILSCAVAASSVMLALALILTIFRIILGPTLPDRVLALDMLTVIAIAFISATAIGTGLTLYVDIAIALGLVGFLATVAFARFVAVRGQAQEDIERAAPFAGREVGQGLGKNGETP